MEWNVITLSNNLTLLIPTLQLKRNGSEAGQMTIILPSILTMK